MATDMRSRPSQTACSPGTATPRRGSPAVLGALAALCVGGAWVLPLWQATLQAPQYPGGLSMQAYGSKVTGDVSEIDTLNHYVGMRAFDPADIPEMALWPLVLVIALVAVGVGVSRRTGWAARLARLYLWLTPLGILAVIQFRLHQYGHDLEPMAALRIDPFTPWVVGPTKVWNFTTWSLPGLGWASLVLAAAVVTFGPRLLDRVRSRGGGTSSAALVLVVPLVLAVAPTASAQEVGHDGHHGHNHGSTVGSTPGVPSIVSGPTDGPALVDHPHAGMLEELLADVEDGGRLVLPAGTYHGPVVIDRPVVIEGEGLPLVVGEGSGSVITVRAPGTVLRGIGVRGSGPGPGGNPAAIRIEADDVRIEDSVVEDAYMGIAVAGASRTALVDNVVRGRAHAPIGDDSHATAHDDADEHHEIGEHGSEGARAEHRAGDDDHTGAHSDHGGGHDHRAGTAGERGDGIWLHDADDVLVRGNLVEDARDGIYTVFGDNALFDGNHVRRSRYAVHSMYADDLVIVENHFDDNFSGGVLMYGGQVVFLRNLIQGSRSTSTGFGLLLKDVADAQAFQNVLVDNRVGVHLDGPTDRSGEAVLDGNTITRNQVGVAAYASAHAAFRANSFADNVVQVMPTGGVLDGISWIDGGVGNYWSSYRGYESAHQPGRGAIAHVEGGAVDRLLLRHPELFAIADTPAMRLLRSIEERWGARTPVATDNAPLTRPVSPAVPEPEGAAARALGTLAAALLLVPSSLVLWRPRRLVPTLWRSRDVVPA